MALRYAGGSGVVNGRCEIWVGGDRHVLPLTTELADWYRYAVQLAPDGTVSVIVDGVLLWQSVEPFPMEELGSLHIALGERSAGTRLAHGRLRLFAGVRYRLH